MPPRTNLVVTAVSEEWPDAETPGGDQGVFAGGTSARSSVVRVADPVVPQTVMTTFPGVCPSSWYLMAAGISSNG